MSEREGYLPGIGALYHTGNGGHAWLVDHALAPTNQFTAVELRAEAKASLRLGRSGREQQAPPKGPDEEGVS